MATVYVNSATGSNAYTYEQAQSSATPWLSVGKVQTDATAGDTAVLQASATSYKISQYTTWSKKILWQATTLGDAIIEPATPGGGFRLDIADAATGTSFTRLKFYNWNINNYGGITYGGIPITFQSCIFEKILMATASVCILQGNGGAGTAVTVNNCLFKDIGCSSTPGTSTAIQGSAGNNYAGITYSWNGNTVDLNPYSFTYRIGSLFAWSYNAQSTFAYKNNIAYTTVSLPFTSNINGSGPAYTRSYSCDYTFSAVPSGTANLTSDPLLVDPSTFNYNLRPSSPCIDAGTNS